MLRLGLRLSLKGGREAFSRLLLTVLAVMVGVTVLLAVFADFHAYQKTSDRSSWESTSGTSISDFTGSKNNAELWNYSENIYKGQFIETLGVATLGNQAPSIPGITTMPGSGYYYASPALVHLIQTVPKNELGDRFPGTLAGTIGEPGLSFPTELAIVIGYTPSQLSHMSNTVVVTSVATSAQLMGTTNIYRIAFGIGAIAILFPLLILINTATRLAAARREERYAAMRLVGATPRQINVVASVEALVGALIGTMLGIAVFSLVRPAIADISFSGVKFFSNYVTPTVWGYVAMLVIVPLAAMIGSLVSLRRVQISPLGVSRKTTPPQPGIWRLIPLVLGIPLMLAAATNVSNNKQNPGPFMIMAAFLLIMIGLVLSGSWLTMQVTRLLSITARSASSLLAARRLSDNPKASFRSVSGVILAVFIGSAISVLIPALNAAQNPTNENSLSQVLRVPYNINPTSTGLSPKQGIALVKKLRSYSGTTVIPVYVNPAFLSFIQSQMNQNGPKQMINPGAQPPDNSIIYCADLVHLRVIGSCAPGKTAVTLDADSLLSGDNPLGVYRSLPIINTASPTAWVNLQSMQLGGLLVKANSAQELEQVRTYLTVYNQTTQESALQQNGGGKSGGPQDGSDNLSAWQMGALEPETIGEVAAIRNNDDTNIEKVVLAIIALTILTAGCSLAVTVGGSLVERKRPFTLLRLSGAPLSTLYRVVLLEAAVPLVAVSIFASAIGLAVAIPVVKTLLKSVLPNGKTIPVHPTPALFIAVGAGLVTSLLLVLLTLPLLSRITEPESARFE